MPPPPTSTSPVDREIQIGGPDVTTYGGMIDELARALGRRPPLRIIVPVLTPRLSSLWIGLVTPVDAGVARPLIEGLSTETVVNDPSGMELLGAEPDTPLREALRQAASQLERGLGVRRGPRALFADEGDQQLVGEVGEQSRQLGGAAEDDLLVDPRQDRPRPRAR